MDPRSAHLATERSPLRMNLMCFLANYYLSITSRYHLSYHFSETTTAMILAEFRRNYESITCDLVVLSENLTRMRYSLRAVPISRFTDFRSGSTAPVAWSPDNGRVEAAERRRCHDRLPGAMKSAYSQHITRVLKRAR